MPWSKPRVVELRDRSVPSLFPNNLAADGHGRYAYAAGRRAVVTHRSAPLFRSLDYDVPVVVSGDDDHQVGGMVTAVHWWALGDRGRTRPLLVIATAPASGEPARIAVFDTSGSKPVEAYSAVVTSSLLGSESGQEHQVDLHFVQGITSTSLQGTPTLVVGASTGHILAFTISAHNSTLVLHRDLRCFNDPVTAVAADNSGVSLLAAADEGARIAAWDTDRDWQLLYSHTRTDDPATCLKMRRNLLFAGHFSGTVTTHDINDCRVTAQIVVSARSVSCLDSHPLQDVVLVAGEDGRVSLLTTDHASEGRMRLLLSVCCNGMPTGAVFSSARDDESPDVSLLFAERAYLLQYEYVRNQSLSRSQSSRDSLQSRPDLSSVLEPPLTMAQ